MTDRERTRLLETVRGLMLADNFGDVHGEINRLCDLLGIPAPEGDYLDGWTERDWENIGGDPSEE